VLPINPPDFVVDILVFFNGFKTGEEELIGEEDLYRRGE